MDEKKQNGTGVTGDTLDLDNIISEFSGTEVDEELARKLDAQIEAEIRADLHLEEETESAAAPKTEAKTEPAAEPKAPVTSDTVRLDVPAGKKQNQTQGDTVRFEPVTHTEAPGKTETEAAPKEKKGKTEPFSEKWEPEYEEPMGEYVPPQPIIFHPRSKLRELKRKLVAGPEKRYYELTELGLGKLQALIFLSLLVVILSGGATVVYTLGMVQPDRLRLMVFIQFFSVLMAALLGCYQMIEGVIDLFRGRFSLNTILMFTFIACCVDGAFCLQEQRVPCCTAFSLQVAMALWSAYHRRSTEMGQMDTLRKASFLHGIVKEPDYYEGCHGLLRTEGNLDDFMQNYDSPSNPEKVLSWYAALALVASIAIGVTAGVIYNSVGFGAQVVSAALLAAVPASAFISQSRPMAILEKRLHSLGTVLCGWQGIKALSRRAVFPVGHEDLFPTGSCKLNGVKFYGDRDTDQVIAYAAALIEGFGGTLAPLFQHLLEGRNGRHYDAQNLRSYGGGGIGGEVEGEPVLVGVLSFMKTMGVEVPEGTRVNQAVYVAIDGELCGLVAVTYSKIRGSAAGISTLCGYRGLQPVLTTGDFMLTESFIRSRFSVNSRRIAFPEWAVRRQMSRHEPDKDGVCLALMTKNGLAPAAFAVTGARSVHTASVLGVIVHMIGGIVGLGMMLALALLGAHELLTPANLLLYQLAWMLPALLVTEWTRSV